MAEFHLHKMIASYLFYITWNVIIGKDRNPQGAFRYLAPKYKNVNLEVHININTPRQRPTF